MTDPSPFLPYTNLQYAGSQELLYARRLISLCLIKDDCWECHLAPVPKGYCYITIGGRQGTKWRAHRLIYTVMHGSFPENLLVMHTCDNRRCINPEHLVLGTSQDDTQDMLRKGRAKYELPDNRKMSDEQVKEAKQLRELGHSLEAIGSEFGVSPTTILNNLRRTNV